MPCTPAWSKRLARAGESTVQTYTFKFAARALAMKPDAILFDEPTSALDPRMAAEVLGVMTDLARSGQTMIVVTHAMTFARQVANTVHIMHAGRLVESGPAEQIFNEPQHDVTRQFLRNVVNGR